MPTAAETPLLQDRMDAHRAFHTFGRVVMAEILTPMVDATARMLAWIERRLTSA